MFIRSYRLLTGSAPSPHPLRLPLAAATAMSRGFHSSVLGLAATKRKSTAGKSATKATTKTTAAAAMKVSTTMSQSPVVVKPGSIQRIVVLNKVSLIDRILRVQDGGGGPSNTNPATTTTTTITTTPTGETTTTTSTHTATDATPITVHPSLETFATGTPIPTDLTTDVTALKAAREHRETVNTVQSTCQSLVQRRIVQEVRVVEHLSPTDVEWAHLVITVGGDGTFIRASHSVDEMSTTPLLGVNSSPSSSFGFYTCATSASFASTLDAVLAGSLSPHTLHRMRAYINQQPAAPPVLNEALFSASSPAASSRYIITGGTGTNSSTTGSNSNNSNSTSSSSPSASSNTTSKAKTSQPRQFQCSSGVWISTAAGSTAAIHSAGGKIQTLSDQRLQYRVRELFKLALPTETLNVGGYLTDDFSITSRMREAHLFLDGCFHPQSLRFGDRLTFKPISQPLHYFLTPSAKKGGDKKREQLRLSKQRLGANRNNNSVGGGGDDTTTSETSSSSPAAK